LMCTEVVENKFDRFATDYYLFLALRYDLNHNCRIKVLHCSNQNWKTIMPAKLREATENNLQFQHVTLTLKSNAGKPNEEDKRIGLIAAGFTEEQAQALRHYDAVLFVNFDQPARMETGEPYLWNVLISHHVLHIVELLIDKRLMNEPPDKHDYEEPEALQHFNRFVAWIGGPDEMIDRYVPCK